MNYLVVHVTFVPRCFEVITQTSIFLIQPIIVGLSLKSFFMLINLENDTLCAFMYNVGLLTFFRDINNNKENCSFFQNI